MQLIQVLHSPTIIAVALNILFVWSDVTNIGETYEDLKTDTKTLVAHIGELAVGKPVLFGAMALLYREGVLLSTTSFPRLLANHLAHHLTFGYVAKTNISIFEIPPPAPGYFTGEFARAIAETFDWRQNSKREYVQVAAHLEKITLSFKNLDEKLTIIRYSSATSLAVLLLWHLGQFFKKRWYGAKLVPQPCGNVEPQPRVSAEIRQPEPGDSAEIQKFAGQVRRLRKKRS